jgi:hypothetical protein
MVSRAGSAREGWRGTAAAAVRTSGAALVGIVLYSAIVLLVLPGGIGDSQLALAYALPLAVGLAAAAVLRQRSGARFPLVSEIPAIHLVLAGWLPVTIVGLNVLVAVPFVLRPPAQALFTLATVLAAAD